MSCVIPAAPLPPPPPLPLRLSSSQAIAHKLDSGKGRDSPAVRRAAARSSPREARNREAKEGGRDVTPSGARSGPTRQRAHSPVFLPDIHQPKQRPHTASSLPTIADRARSMKNALQRGGFAAQSMETRRVWEQKPGK